MISHAFSTLAEFRMEAVRISLFLISLIAIEVFVAAIVSH